MNSRLVAILLSVMVVCTTMVHAAAESVSMVALIANPEKYEGRQVQIIGFLNLEFEGNAIYLHEQDLEHAICKNGIWVSIDDKHAGLSGRYVLLEGVFTAKRQGHLGLWSGEIREINRVIAWPAFQPRVKKK